MTYTADVKLGEKYRDEQTGVEGTAVGLTFQYGRVRVSIESVRDGEIKEYVFDAPRLASIETNEKIEADDNGGPDRGTSHVRRGPVAR